MPKQITIRHEGKPAPWEMETIAGEKTIFQTMQIEGVTTFILRVTERDNRYLASLENAARETIIMDTEGGESWGEGQDRATFGLAGVVLTMYDGWGL